MTEEDTRREGDDRPAEDDPEVSLTVLPCHGKPFRWLPKHGAPLCIGEWFSQRVVKSLAYLPIYTAIIVTLTLLTFLLVEFWL